MYSVMELIFCYHLIGLAKDFSISNALAVEIPQSSAKPMIYEL